MSALVGIIDGRCGCRKCVERTEDIYRMVGSCSNCDAGPFLILYRAGDPKADQDCPTCGNDWTVRRYSQRRANEDEVPTAAGLKEGQ